MEGQIAHARELSKIDVDSEIQPAFIDGASFQAARRIAQRFSYVGRRKLDSPPFERLRQQAKCRLLDRALSRIGIGRFQIVGFLILLAQAEAAKNETASRVAVRRM